MEGADPFNPLDKRHLGESVANALISQPGALLPPQAKFDGAGIYAIYYSGSFPAYQRLKEVNSERELTWPIYVGKAVSAGARKGNFGLGISAGGVLFRRLHEHSRCIDQAENLNLLEANAPLTVDKRDFPCSEGGRVVSFASI